MRCDEERERAFARGVIPALFPLRDLVYGPGLKVDRPCDLFRNVVEDVEREDTGVQICRAFVDKNLRDACSKKLLFS